MSTYLGQNFLTDIDILKHIVSTIDQLLLNSDSTTLIEIGPGRGALTKRIVKLPAQLICIEKDIIMQHYLDPLLIQYPMMSVVYQDVLEIKSEELRVKSEEGRNENDKIHIIPQKTLVVGNLPYYITSPILRKFFGSTQAEYAGGVFLIQKEVAEKIVHDAPKKSFLRWLINYAYRVEYCFSVPPKAFNPPPKVMSAVIRLVPKTFSEIPTLSYDTMMIFLDQYSPFKRKTLASSSKIVTKLLKKGDSDQTVFDVAPFGGMRLEELGRREMEEIIDFRL